jgi:hypothetical protein
MFQKIKNKNHKGILFPSSLQATALNLRPDNKYFLHGDSRLKQEVMVQAPH